MRVLLSYYFVTLRENDLENLSVIELLRLFVKTLTANDKYSLCNIWNLQKLSQIQLPKKHKNTFSIFLSISEVWIKFSKFGKKDSLHSLCILEITDCETHGKTYV